ncbi:hypothetical protein ABEB36_010122 [Hypothenemus hampei]|uniref:Uncharacterized protein n=1 Tax=Hypothenemus hampei TaxID=57062 RepID=A0ABD1EIL5_HYPHA
MRGGPISTRRLSVTCEHYLLRELKELLENSRDDMTPGSKVSVLVFKEGDIINLLRVIENEDGSYSPYNDCPISPPTKPSRRDTLEAFERLVEDTEMCTKVATLKKKIEQMNLRKQNKNKGDGDWKHCTINDKDDKGKHMSYKFLEECTGEMLDSIDLPIFDRNIDEGNQSECEELALKDKHRTKPKTSQSLPIPKSLFNERKGSTYSHARHSYAKIAKRRDPRLFEDSERNSDGSVTFSRDRVLGAASSQTSSSSFNILNPYYSGASFSMLENGPAGMAPYPERNRKSGNKCSENPYLLQGLHSNKLPGLRILDTDDFLKEDLHPERILDGTLRRTPGSSSDNGFINSTPNCMGNNGATYLGAAQVPESNFVGLRDHDYSLARSNYNLTSKLSQTHSLDSSTYCHLSSSYLNNKLPQTNNYSLTSMNTLSQSSDSTLDASNLAQIESLGNMPNSRDESPILEATEGASVEDVGAKLAEQLHLLDEEPETDLYEVTARNRVHLTRLVLASEGTERPKSTPDSIELEEHTRDVWEIHEPPSERLKHSATCKWLLLSSNDNSTAVYRLFITKGALD